VKIKQVLYGRKTTNNADHFSIRKVIENLLKKLTEETESTEIHFFI